MAAKKHTTQLVFSFTEAEIWRPVLGYEGLYEVSNLGRVRSLERQVFWSLDSPKSGLHTGWRTHPVRILRPSGKCKDGRHYLNVALCKNGIINKQQIHTLVLSTFVGLRQPGMVANHRDGDRSNNALTNLEWVTSKRNSQHAVEIGSIIIGEQSPSAKLTEKQVREIRDLASKGLSHPDIARIVGATGGNVWAIVHRKSWKHLS